MKGKRCPGCPAASLVMIGGKLVPLDPNFHECVDEKGWESCAVGRQLRSLLADETAQAAYQRTIAKSRASYIYNG